MQHAKLDKYSSQIQTITNDFEKIDFLIKSYHEVKHDDIKYAFALTQEAERLARSINYQKGLADSLRAQGELYFLEFNYELALINLFEARRIYQEIDDKKCDLESLDFIGDIYFNLTGYDSALYYYTESLKIREEFNEEPGTVISYNNIAKVYEHLGYYDQALNYYLKSLIINENLQNYEGQINSLISIGRIYECQEDYEHGITYYERALTEAEKHNSRDYIAEIFCKIGLAYESLKLFEKALDYHEKSLSLRIKADDRLGEAVSLNYIGKIHENLDNYLRALTFYFKSWQLFENQQDRLGEAKTLLGIGNMFIKRTEGYKAPKYLYKVLKIAEELSAKDLIYKAYHALSLSYKQMSNFEKALLNHERFHESEKIFLNEQAKEKTKSLVIQFEVDKTQKEAEIYQLKNVELANAYDELKKVNDSLEQANKEKSDLVKELDKLARKDPLTSLFNRRHFDQKFVEEIGRANRYKHPLTFAITDIDFFKRINDNFSHQVGDEVLVNIAAIFRSSIRQTDIVARYGGEEFVLLFPETDVKNSALACEKIRKTIETYDWNSISEGLKVTVSFGVSQMRTENDTTDDIIKEADQNLYKAKNNGRNQVMCSQ